MIYMFITVLKPHVISFEEIQQTVPSVEEYRVNVVRYRVVAADLWPKILCNMITVLVVVRGVSVIITIVVNNYYCYYC